jgi:Big-like domain-containing protein
VRAAVALAAALAAFGLSAPVAGAATLTAGGPPVAVEVATSGDRATATFDGVAGSRVSLEVVDVTIGTSVCCGVKISIEPPSGKTLASATIGTNGGFLDTVALPSTGTYTVVVDPSSTNTGSATLRLYDVPPDPTVATAPGAGPFTLTTTTPGQNASATFDASAGDRVSLTIDDVTIGTSLCCSTRITLLRPDGRQVASTMVGTNGGFFDAQTLPNTGAYTVVVDPQGTATGSADLRVDAVPADATGTIAPDGATVRIDTAVAGQNADLTFDGTSGGRIALTVLPDCCFVSVTVVRPDGKMLASTTASSFGGFVDAVSLPSTGTYTIHLDPQGAATGSIAVALYMVPPDVTATLTPNGPPATVTTTTPGQNAALTFPGVSGQRVSIAVAPGCCSARITVVKPNGQTLGTPTTVSSFGGFVDTADLTMTGTYTLLVDPQGTAAGDMTLTLYDVPADPSTSISPDGSPVTVSTTTPGQNAVLTFAGTAGERISLAVGPSCCSTKITLAKPNGTAVATFFASTAGGFLDTTTLPTSTTYSIVVDPQSGATGDVTLRLYDVPADAAATISPDGSPVTVTTTTPGQNAVLTFSGSVGDRVSVQTSGSCCRAQVSLVKPDGTTLAGVTTFGAGGFLDAQTLPMNGTYTILVDPAGSETGSVTVSLFSVAADVSGTIVPLEAGGSPVPVSITTAGQNARLGFTSVAGSRVSVELTNVTIGSSTFSGTRVSLLAPDGSTLGNAVTIGTNGGLIDTVALPTDGAYTILVDPQGANTGGIVVSLHEVPADVTATITPGGAPLSLTLSSPGQNARVTFAGTAGERVSLALSDVTIGAPSCCAVRVSLLRPDGSTLGIPVSVGPSGGFLDAALLPTGGTYTILVDPQGTSTGNITLQLYDVPADATAAATPGASSVTVTTDVPGQNAMVTFAATAGDRVSLRVGPTCCIERVELVAPGGATLAGPMSFGTGGGFVDTVVLPSTGTYTFSLDPSGASVGSTTVTVYAVPADATGTLTAGSSVTLTTTVPGQNASATFTGGAGDGMKLTVGPFNCCSTKISVVDASGIQVVAPTSFNPDGGVLLTRLPADGTYTVLVDPQGPNVGAINLSLAFDNTAPAPPTLTLTTTSPDSYVSGTTFFYRPSGAGGTFSVAATTSDGGAGLQKVRFPGLTGGLTPTSAFDDLLSPYSQTYSWAPGATYAAADNAVTAFDRVGNTAATTFAVTPDSAAPATTDDTASLGSSWKNTTQTVVLLPSDGSGSGAAATYATSDGSTPTTASPQGTTVTLSADGVYTVEYFSVDRVGNVEAVRTAGTQIRIDKTAPATASLGTLPATIRNGQTLTGSGTDALSGVDSITYLYCSGGACTPSTAIGASSTGPSYAVTWAAMPADGTYQVVARVRDVAGNTRDSAKQTVTIDNTAPNTTVTGPANPTNATDAAFGFASTEAGSTFECSLDGGAFVSCSAPKTYSGLTAGSHTFEVRATDPVGNVDSTPASFTWTIDLTPPDTTISSGPASPTAGTTATFAFASSEGGSTFQCRLDGTVATACASPKTYSGLAEGAHTFTVAAADAAGNVDPTPASYAWTVDVSAPETTITSGPAAPTSQTGATFAFSASEAGSSFECQLDGAGFAACSSGISFTALAAGGHVFQARAIDTAGNTDPTPATWAWTIDTTAPETTITSGPADPTNATGASFSFASGEAGSTFACRIDGGSFAPCSAPVSYSGLAAGTHTFEVAATDLAGNTDPTPASSSWRIDTAAPETTITAEPSDPTSLTGASFAFTSDEAGSTFECSLDGAPWAACTSPKTYAGLAEGSHAFSVRAVDPAGNADPTPATRSWTVDLTAPDTTITGHPADPTSSTTASFSFASEAGATFECRLDGGAFAQCSSPASYPGLAFGSHTFAVRATDAAGNADATPATFTWTVDTTPPETTISSGPSGATSLTSAGFDFAASESGSTFECSLDGAAFSGCAPPLTFTGLAEGAHSFSVRATDAAGNADPTPASRSWTVDTTPPAAPAITAPADGAEVNVDAVTLSGTSEPSSTVRVLEAGVSRGQTTAAADGSWTKTLTGVPDGSHAYTATATDAAGNASSESAPRTVVIDTTAPNTVLGTGPAGSTPSSTASFTFSASEPGSTFECSLDGAAFVACSSPITYSGLAEGAHTFSVRAVDGAGNVDATPATRAWTVDRTAPAAPEILSPADGALVATSSVTLSGTAEPGALVEVFDGGTSKGTASANALGAWSKAVSGLADGAHSFAATASDAAGNTSPVSATHTVVVDTAAPETTIDSGPATPTTDTTATFAFSASETGSTFECSLDGGLFSACSSPFVLDPVALGDHVFDVRATDGAGNVDPSPASYAWSVQ